MNLKLYVNLHFERTAAFPFWQADSFCGIGAILIAQIINNKSFTTLAEDMTSKIYLMGMCYPGYIWYEHDVETQTTLWSGFNLWALLDILRMLGVDTAATTENVQMIEMVPLASVGEVRTESHSLACVQI